MKSSFYQLDNVSSVNKQNGESQLGTKNNNLPVDPITYFFYHSDCQTLEEAVERARGKDEKKEEEDLTVQRQALYSKLTNSR